MRMTITCIEKQGNRVSYVLRNKEDVRVCFVPRGLEDKSLKVGDKVKCRVYQGTKFMDKIRRADV